MIKYLIELLAKLDHGRGAGSRVSSKPVRFSLGDSATPTSKPMASLSFSAHFVNKPDPSLEEDEWHVIFHDYRDLTKGIITKVPWPGGSNMVSTFVVKKINKLPVLK